MWRKEPIDVLRGPLRRFLQAEVNAGLLLLAAAGVAMIWANSPWNASYFALWEHEFALRFDDHVLAHDLRAWINDGLMAMFFFVVGLELKRELIGGRLSMVSTAALPIAAAIGGMVFPALIYLTVVGWEGPALSGWGIPMATDIAFAVGVLVLLGDRVSTGLKLFLTTLAIVDDLGAVLVIAFFYTSDVSLANLMIGLGFLAVLMGGNWLGVRSPVFYGLVGIGGLWLAFLLSGVHATVAGVLVAATIPGVSKVDRFGYLERMRRYIREFARSGPEGEGPAKEARLETAAKVVRVSERAVPPLQRLERRLRPVVIYLVVPLFALANAGVVLPEDPGAALLAPVSVGVALGLFLGKPIGILGISWLVTRLGLAREAEDFSWRHLLGASLLAGIGFTMSLFITQLAFVEPIHGEEAKLGILAGSLVAGTAGWSLLRRTAPGGRSA